MSCKAHNSLLTLLACLPLIVYSFHLLAQLSREKCFKLGWFIFFISSNIVTLIEFKCLLYTKQLTINKRVTMRKFHPFFTIGTVGTIVISSLHIFLALGVSLTAVHTTFFVLYPLFIALLIIGFALTLKKQKETKVV